MKPNLVFADKQNTVQQSYSPSVALPANRKKGIEKAFPSARNKSNYVGSKYKVDKSTLSNENQLPQIVSPTATLK